MAKKTKPPEKVEHELVARVAENLRMLRQMSGATQQAVAMQMGLSLGYLQALEKGRREPSLSMLARLARGYDTQAWRLLR